MESSLQTHLDWYQTSYGDVFPGCADCCELCLSPLLHQALNTVKLAPNETADLPAFQDTMATYHAGGHTFLKNTKVPKRKALH